MKQRELEEEAKRCNHASMRWETAEEEVKWLDFTESCDMKQTGFSDKPDEVKRVFGLKLWKRTNQIAERKVSGLSN